MFFPINCTTYLGHSIYHEFTLYLITLIFAYGYEFKEMCFLTLEPKYVFCLKSLFEAFQDKIIFISRNNWSLIRHILAQYLLVTILSKHV